MMGLFHFGKKAEVRTVSGPRVERVKVLGAGCKSCNAMLAAAQSAVKSLDFHVEVEYITDMEKIAAYGVMRLPALVVNDKVVSSGKVLGTNEIRKLLKG